MTKEIIKVPDIGADSAEVTEVLVEIGEALEADDSIAVLESDKASVEVPCPKAGTVTDIKFKIGDELSEGMGLIEIEIVGSADEAAPAAIVEEPAPEEPTAEPAAAPEVAAATTDSIYQVPDIGADEAEVTEVMVSAGDQISEGDSIIVAESDKASVEVPAEAGGTVVAVHVNEGDKVQQGQDLITISVAGAVVTTSEAAAPAPEPQAEPDTAPAAEAPVPAEAGPVEYLVPDMGSDSAEIIEIPVSVGDSVDEGDTLVVVETDKASVEVPAEAAGEILELHVSVGGNIAQGDKLVTLKTAGEVAPTAAPAPSAPAPTSAEEKKAAPAPAKPAVAQTAVTSSKDVHAGPAVRKLARELGVDLGKVKATGQRGRILKDDVHAYVKQALKAGPSTGAAAGGAGIPEIPAVDWSQFGEIDVQPQSRISKATADNMSRCWLNVPHVTQFDDADVTDLEQYRAYLKPEGVARGIKMTPLAFLLRASAIALKENPKFNTALSGTDLVERKFFHISIAVDTPAGLMVPVIRDVDQKDIWELASEVSTLAGKAKEGKLSPKEMQGASFTISSLGAIGGTGFTPIVPAPQVGILGVSKTSIQPVWDGTNFVPRKLMPLALSYDHRVVNGADAGKFLTCFVEVLSDLEKIWNG